MSHVLYGREVILTTLRTWVEQGEVVVLVGRIGAGKSALLDALERWARHRGLPCALAARTDSLADFTSALGRAYPWVSPGRTQRQWRARLRAAAQDRPGVLLFDELGHTGTAFKAAIKSVRGMGLGIVLAADVDQSRDRERVRSLGLTYREVELGPLHGGSMRTLMRALVATRTLAFSLSPEDFRSLAAATEGLPGRAVEFADALTDAHAWRDRRPRIEWLRTGSVIRAAERYRRPIPALTFPTADDMVPRGAR